MVRISSENYNGESCGWTLADYDFWILAGNLHVCECACLLWAQEAGAEYIASPKIVNGFWLFIFNNMNEFF